MKLKIQLNSFWATGTGKAGGSLDSIVLKDEDNLPYIPGKTLKGLLRDAYKECGFKNEEFLFGHKKGKSEDNLSKESLAKGNLRFNSARIVEGREEIIKYSYLLYKTKTAISIDDNGQAEHQSVRKNEVTIPVVLEVDLYYKNDKDKNESKTDVSDLKNACRMLRLLGEKRYRGLGRCIINVKSDCLESKENSERKESFGNNINELVFKCKLNEPIILIKKDKTEHNIESLDYIPGSIFRGIVASNLFGKNPNDVNINPIIFDNTVQFEDAHISYENNRTLKIPYSFYKQKEKENIFLNFSEIEDWSKKTKQQKTGYFVHEKENEKLKCVEIKYGSIIKSSRSIAKRASEKGGLFTYHYLEKNQEFIFSVKSKSTEYLKEVQNILTKRKHFIGKSALTEFGGAVDISLIAKKTNNKSETVHSKYIYAESNLCFLNEFGEFTATPSAKQLTGNEKAKINWLKSQIKIRQYAPYNGFRKNWDSERLIIEKGSVFVLDEEVDITTNKKGLFQTEGYGTILINPTFLSKDSLKYNFKELDENKKDVDKHINKDSSLLKYLKEESDAFQEKTRINNKAKGYVKFKQQKNSQWARIYNATTKATDKESLKRLLLTDARGNKNCSVLNGGSNQWDEQDINKFNNELLEDANPIQLIRKIAKNNIKK